MEERRHARYGGSPILFLVDCIRDTDTLARVDDERFAILAIQAGADAASIVGRLRLHLELRRIHQCEVTLAQTAGPADAWRTLEEPARPTLRLVRPEEAGL